MNCNIYVFYVQGEDGYLFNITDLGDKFPKIKVKKGESVFTGLLLTPLQRNEAISHLETFLSESTKLYWEVFSTCFHTKRE